MSVFRSSINAIERFSSGQSFQLGGWNILYRILNKLAPSALPFHGLRRCACDAMASV